MESVGKLHVPPLSFETEPTGRRSHLFLLLQDRCFQLLQGQEAPAIHAVEKPGTAPGEGEEEWEDIGPTEDAAGRPVISLSLAAQGASVPIEYSLD